MEESSIVVVGVDGSAESRQALRFALEDAHRRAARVKAVTAYLSPEYWAASYGMSALPTIEEVVEDNLTVTRDVLKAVVEAAPALGDVPIDVVALPGAPARVLIEEAQGAALLVVGHRGRGGFKSAVLGIGRHALRAARDLPGDGGAPAAGARGRTARRRRRVDLRLIPVPVRRRHARCRRTDASPTRRSPVGNRSSR